MHRRRLIWATGGLATIALAGCAGGGAGSGGSDGDGGDGSGGDGSGGSPGDGDGQSGTPDTSFSVGATRCGTQTNEAEVTFGDGTVTVEGTTWGNDACYTARLDSAAIAGGTLTVAVVTESTAGEDEACAQCITEIEYRATVGTASTPGEVVVTHDGETVTTATR